MDLSVITDEMLIDRFTVFVLVEGRDLAGNLVLVLMDNRQGMHYVLAHGMAPA